MSSRPHGRGLHHRGGYGHHRGGHWVGHRGGHRGGGGGRSDYHPPPHHMRGGRSPRPPPPRPPPPRHRPDPEKLLAALGPDAQLALTTALINTVLKTSEDKEGRGSFREGGREGPYRHRDPHREGRGGGYFKEDMRPRRQYATESPRGRYESRWSEDGGRRGGGQHHHHFDREKSGPYYPQHDRYGHRYQPMGQGNKRRPSPSANAHPGSYKRQRMEMGDGDRSSYDNHHHREDDYMEEDGGSGEGSHRGDSKWSWQREEERRARSSTQEDIGQREGPRRSEGEGGGGGKDSEGGGVQVTIRADGERAVNSDGHVRRVAGRLFVDLRCPHCPNQKSITFKEYKLHLTSDHHKSQLNKLARKHTVVLRKIRLKQRQEQKEIEDKWREDNPEEFKTAVSRFCNTCKLAFKSIGTGNHNRSKLHRMQRHYLHPRCGLCRITFPSRMVYEHHIASINHLRVRTATLDNQGGEGSGERARRMDQHAREEDRPEDLDLANFMTVDSVGEDDEEGGSEHEEITGGLDAVEAAEEADTRNDTDDELERGTKRRRQREVDDEVAPLLETDWNREQPEEEEEEGGHKPMGTDYVRRVEAYYCSLCYKIIRADSSLGSRAVQRHCRSVTHLSHYWDHHPAPHQDEDEDDKMQNEEEEEEEDRCSIDEDGVGTLELEMDQEQDKLWDEVDKGLSELRGEILTEIEGESIKENVKEETLNEKDTDKKKESQKTKETPEEEEKTPSERVQ